MARPAVRVALASYAAGVAALGGLVLSGEFVYVWAPLPHWVPWPQALAFTYGATMLALAAGLFWRRTAVLSSLLLTFLFLGWLLLVHVPRIVSAPSREFLWSGAARITSVVAGSWILFASLAAPASPTERERWFRGSPGIRTARVLYAAALPMFGLHHFFDLAGAADAVPAWLPFRLGWACLTGVGHVAAGLAIVLRIAARPAANLEAAMITAFVVLVHVPGVIGAPHDRLQWSMLVVASTIAGAAWVVASSYRHEPAARRDARAERKQR